MMLSFLLLCALAVPTTVSSRPGDVHHQNYGRARLPEHSFSRPSFWRSRHATAASLCSNLGLLRGGEIINDYNDGYGYEGDEEDEYSDDEDEEDVNEAEEDEATAMHQKRRNLHRHKDAPSPYPDRPQRQPAAPYIPRPKKKKNALVQMAKSSISMSKKAAMTTVQSSGKAAFYLMRPKSIQEKEIWGIWRLDQQSGHKQSTANIELTPTGFVIVRANNKIVWEVPYKFITPVWPQSPRVEFLAPAFQPHPKSKPWLLSYKGYLERKVADSSIIKMVGTLYETEHPKTLFGRDIKDAPLKYHKIGSFVGRRRVVIDDDEEEDYSGDEEEDYSDNDEPPRKRRKLDDEDEEDYQDGDDFYDYDDEEEL